MVNMTATSCDVTFFNDRIFPLADYRRVVRAIGDGVVIGFGAVATASVLIISVTVVAAWIMAAVLSTAHLRAGILIEPKTIALANYPTPTNAAAFPVSAQVLTGPDDTPRLTFEARWERAMAPALAQISTVLPVPQLPRERVNNIPLPPPHPLNGQDGQAKHKIVRSLIGEAAPRVAAATPPASFLQKRVIPQAHNNSISLPGLESGTAVYDIAAHTVYLPNGRKLEAHSGLGNQMDDPRYVSVKNRGPTPPNVYDLSLRDQLFHGVRAIRLNPVDGDKMFGRDGILAHSYMLGPNGQSNGCVSFRDYPEFLHAYLRGDVDRLVVVSNFRTAPSRVARFPQGHGNRYALNGR